MGQVYEAEDLELHQNLALKTIRPEIAQDERAIARFKREAFLARQVTHPNICRIFDIFVHRPPAVDGVAAPPITFVTMQLLNGQTLAERLRAGRMTADEALPLIVQMADALDAAHQVGVVHRDFKCNNVMLLPQPGGPRAVVTDFGMAWRAGEDPDKRGTSPTLPGEILGTPDYMAPEQLEGGKVTPATDVYALGLVMYEMATSVRPFWASSPMAEAVKRLCEAPRPPRELAPDLDARWDAAIMRCLARRPEDRFQRAGDVVAALRGERRAAQAWRTFAAGLLLAAAVIGLAAAFVWRGRPPAAAPVPAAAPGLRVRRRPERAPALDCRPRVPERLRAAGRRLAVDRIRRDADDRTGRRRAAADDPRREHRPHEDRAGARGRRHLRARHARPHPRLARQRSRRPRLVRHRSAGPAPARSAWTRGCRTRGRAARWRWSARPAPKRKC